MIFDNDFSINKSKNDFSIMKSKNDFFDNEIKK